MNENTDSFSAAETAGVYRAIFERRDVRSQFLSTPVPPAVLARLITAAHHAPSVGFMQPWDFIVIEGQEVRSRVLASFELENERAQAGYEGVRQEQYSQLKLQGILESPLNVCITCSRDRGGAQILGRNTIIDTDLFSTCLAVQNFWLAARAEGVGVGWVSILDQAVLAKVLELPENVYPLAYLCVGYVSEFMDQPELQRSGWRKRLPVATLIHGEHWKGAPSRSLVDAMGPDEPLFQNRPDVAT